MPMIQHQLQYLIAKLILFSFTYNININQTKHDYQKIPNIDLFLLPTYYAILQIPARPFVSQYENMNKRKRLYRCSNFLSCRYRHYDNISVLENPSSFKISILIQRFINNQGKDNNSTYKPRYSIIYRLFKLSITQILSQLIFDRTLKGVLKGDNR